MSKIKKTLEEELQQNFFPNQEKVENLLSDFVFVEGGTFIMGSPETEEERYDDETQHKVTVDSFYMQASVVTQELWEAVMGNNPSSEETGSDLPVTDVNWYDCQEFIKAINELTGKHYRLPTEEEWEYAAKGGNKSKGYIYSGSNNIKEVAWYEENSGDRLHVVKELQANELEIYDMSSNRLHVVKELQANELGLYDMSGNVREWCEDCYAPYELEEKYNQNPKEPDNAKWRVLRGGCWDDELPDLRSAYRYSSRPNTRNGLVGFRIVVQK